MAAFEQTYSARPRQWRPAVAITGQIAVHLCAALPLLWLFYAIDQGLLGGDPVKELIHFLGLGALRLLMLTLLVSPLASALSFGQLNRLRRPLGLWCFAWGSLHLCAWLALELAFDWSLFGSELIEHTYILVGFAAWVLLLALAVTSLPKLMRLMRQNWKRLHGLVYLVLLLGCWHFWWSVKSGWIEPAAYLSVAVLLLFSRRVKVIKWLRSFA